MVVCRKVRVGRCSVVQVGGLRGWRRWVVYVGGVDERCKR